MANNSSCATVTTTGAHFGTCIPQRVFVGGIPRDTTELELKTFFTTYGTVKDSKIIMDKAGGSRGYAFITFEKQDEAERLLSKDSEPIFFRNRRLNIGPAVKRHLTPQNTVTADPRENTPLYYGNSLSYAYQNGMPLIHTSNEEALNYGLSAHGQASNYPAGAVVLPQHQAAYLSPAAYYNPLGATQWLQPASHWGLGSAAASPQYIAGNPTYYFANYPSIQYAPEIVYAQSAGHPYSVEPSSYMENYQIEAPSENLDTPNGAPEMGGEYLQAQSPPLQGKATLIAYPRCSPMAISAHHQQHYQNLLLKQQKKSLALLPSAQQTYLQKTYSDSESIGNMILTPPPTPGTK